MAVSNFIYNAYRDYSSKRSALLMDPVFQGEDVPKGKREAILLIPGFTAGDWTFSTMSPWLQQIGYRTYLLGININVGCPQRRSSECWVVWKRFQRMRAAGSLSSGTASGAWSHALSPGSGLTWSVM